MTSLVEFLILVNFGALERGIQREPLSRHLENPETGRDVFRTLNHAAVYAVICRRLRTCSETCFAGVIVNGDAATVT